MKRVFLTFYIFIIFSLLIVQFVFGPLLGKVVELYLHDFEIEYNKKLSQGVFHMLEQDLLKIPSGQWVSHIDELSNYFGYKIFITPIKKLELEAPYLEQLQGGEIAVVDGGEYLYSRVGSSDMVLGKGPFSLLDPDMLGIQIVFWLALIVLVGLLTLLWIVPYWRKLRKISAAATAFGDGDFSTRVEITSQSSLSPIAAAFNTMADRIQQLINSHKELTNAVSHELRTPITRIRFGLEMLENSANDEKRTQYTKGLYTDVAELEDLVTELLTFARFDRERPELEMKQQLLLPFLEYLCDDLVTPDSPVACMLRNKLPEDSELVKFDPKYLTRAIANLLQNGFKYGKQRLEVTIERVGTDCCIHIDDDGSGIVETDYDRIFEPFTRLDASRNRDSGGYGLGLAIVSRIMQWYNGSVSVTKAPIGGARFTLTWPGFSG